MDELDGKQDVHEVATEPFPSTHERWTGLPFGTSCRWLSHPARTSSPLRRPDGPTDPPGWLPTGQAAADSLLSR